MECENERRTANGKTAAEGSGGEAVRKPLRRPSDHAETCATHPHLERFVWAPGCFAERQRLTMAAWQGSEPRAAPALPHFL